MIRFLSYCIIVHFLVVQAYGQGRLNADYYNGVNFDTYIGSQTVESLDFYWNENPPIQGIDPHYCSVRYTSMIRTPISGNIKFSARVDDGIRVYIDDQIVLKNWQLNDVGLSDGTVYMEADQHYRLTVEYFNAEREAELQLLWVLPEDEDEYWLISWWNGDDPKKISSEYFSLIPEEVKKEDIQEIVEEPLAVELPRTNPSPVINPDPEILVQDESNVQNTEEETTEYRVPREYTAEEIETFIPKSVEFEQAKSEILPVSFAQLDRLASFLVNNPAKKLKIEGHTDSIGDPVKNQEGSEQRARAVAAYLIKQGVSHTQIISALGYGGTRPIIPGDGKTQHPENRRVEFVIE